MSGDGMPLPATGESWVFGSIFPYEGVWPKLPSGVFVAPGATIIGRVTVGAGSNIWPATVVRGDENFITIGEDTNIQDGTIVHIDHRTFPTIIGHRVTIGHRAVIHACTLEDESFIGMGSVVLDGAVVESRGMLAAGAVLTPGKRIPSGELWSGVPAKPMRRLSQEEMDDFKRSAHHYGSLARQHARDLLVSCADS